jgi:hypothetical protein
MVTLKMGSFYGDVGAQLSSRLPFQLPQATLSASDRLERRASGAFRVSSGRDCRDQGCATDEAPDNPEEPSSVSRVARGVRGLPLGAKIGATIVFALLAWWIGFLGFVAALDRRLNAVQGLGYLVGAIGLFSVGVIPWW